MTIKPSTSTTRRIIHICFTITIILILFWHNWHLNEREDTYENTMFPETQNYTDSLSRADQSNSPRTSYFYHNYSTLESDLEKLDNEYPSLIEIDTAQDLYGLPDCTGGYKIWIVRITNENLGFNKPEVLFIGGHHGDEPISVEAPYYLIEFLVQNYASNPFIRHLVDHREIYVIPVVNPWGWEYNIRYNGDNQDINRDYPYDESVVGPNSDGIPLSTVGAQTVYELMSEHLFINAISWHSGWEMIGYAWGCYARNGESPDEVAFRQQGLLMQQLAGAYGGSYYPTGRINDILGPAYGAWSDFGYAGTWDTVFENPSWTTNGARALAYCVEISNIRKPSSDTLGGNADIFTPGGIEDGYIPKNLRIALIALDLAEPYLTWLNPYSHSALITIPVNNSITLNWSVNGSFQVTQTRILYGTDPNPNNNYIYSTQNRSGGSHWAGGHFSEKITVPTEPGDYYFVAHAIVDQDSLNQNNPIPAKTPQSLFVNQRTNDTWSASNNGNTMQGSLDWYSPILHVKVTAEVKNQIKIINHPKLAYCNKPLNISWSIKTDGEINHTEVHWGLNNDVHNQSHFQTASNPGAPGIFYSNLILPSRPTYYYFAAQFTLIPESSPTSPDILEYWSQIIQIEVIPEEPYQLSVSLPIIKYLDGYQQTLILSDIICSNSTISDYQLNETFMIEHKVAIRRFDPDLKTNITSPGEQNFVFDLRWSDNDNYWYLPIQNVSNWPSGWYQVVCQFKHRYGVGESNNIIDLNMNNWFKLEHIIVVTKPSVEIFDNENLFLNILNVTGWCSKNQLGNLDETEILDTSYEIRNRTNGSIFLTGILSWSSTNNSWQALQINIDDLPSGDYYVKCEFIVPEVGTGESSHMDGDGSEFTVIPKKDTAKKSDDNQKAWSFEALILIAILFVFIIFILIFFIMVLRIRKKQ